MAATIAGPGWVDHSYDPTPGQYNLAAERYLNASAGKYLPTVTTQTTVARYFVLHGLVADERVARDLNDLEHRDLLKRVEVAFAAVSMAHRENAPAEHGDRSPHGVNGLTRLLEEAGAIVIEAGTATYAKAPWGFWGQYYGAERALEVTGASGGYGPGAAFTREAVRALEPLLDLAASDEPLTAKSLAPYAGACLCRMSSAADGEWLARLLAGKGPAPSAAHRTTRATLRLLARAMALDSVKNINDFDDIVLFDPTASEDSEEGEFWEVWRGLRFRAQSVGAWLYLWSHLLSLLGDNGGALPQEVLADYLADQVGTGTVREFVSSLPPIADGAGVALPAERTVNSLSAPEKWIAVLALGAARLKAADEDGDRLRLGLVGEEIGPAGRRTAREELSPRWVSTTLGSWMDRSLQDFTRYLAHTMVRRAHRLTLAKAFWRSGRLVLPGRIKVQDGLVIKLWDDNGWVPTMRLPNLLTIGQQVGLFERSDDGVWKVGPYGGLLD
ncbi:hypothetical protein MWU57_08185 [Isoptericola sp. S6320L]|uniref:hypothetical protein n=1 Tax=Isoptericola sp. S6320L TaxID=2926411 RepID=UPI001FF4AFB0|nr:hypothetical protein [Isoptericola sp. S6320L]MCK0117013.1 hypothetical protein [Isoptericola sp. S6320L]